jgi:hypothetical protein
MTYLLGAMVVLSCLAVPAQQLRYAHAAHLYIEDNPDRDPILSGPVAIPANVAFLSVSQDVVGEMLRRSPTFRAQCSRIAADSHLRVVVEKSLLVPADGAMTNITRNGDGEVDADVQLGTLGDPILLIAHEFEHILEQLDGVDLPAMAARASTGVVASSRSGHFETQRAIEAGQRVAREVSRVIARR